MCRCSYAEASRGDDGAVVLFIAARAYLFVIVPKGFAD